MSLHTLVIETYTWTPALETAGEIAIDRAIEGHRTGFCFLEVPNPDDRPRFEILERVGLWRRSRKVARLVSTLGQFGVEVMDMPFLDAASRRRVTDFANAVPTTLDELRAYCYGDARLGAGVVASLVDRTRNSLVEPGDHTRIVREYLEGAALSYEMTMLLLARHRPEVVITYNGRLAAPLGVAEAARVRGVPVEYHEVGSTFDKYEIFPDRPQDPRNLKPLIQRLWSVAGPDRERVASECFRRRRSGENTGALRFVELQQPGLLPKLSPGRRQVVYFTSTDYETEFVGRPTTYALFETQAEGVSHLVRWASARPDVALTIRVHPFSRHVHASNLEWLRTIRGDNVVVIPPESPVDSYALMARADLVVTWGSMVGVEAANAGRPSIVIADAFYSGLGCVYEPETIDALDALLSDESLPALPPEASLPAGYWVGEFGRRFRHYEPTGFGSGRFLGRELLHDPEWCERMGVSQAARAVWRRMHGR